MIIDIVNIEYISIFKPEQHPIIPGNPYRPEPLPICPKVNATGSQELL
jgi:hypothetical protein